MRPESLQVCRCLLAAGLLGCSGLTAAQDTNRLLTGKVVSLEAQEIFVPLTSNWQAGISKLVEEGSSVQTGDLVVEFDGAAAYSQLESQRETQLAEQAVTERDLARLEKELEQARYALKRAQTDLRLKELKAETPEGLIGAIEYEENQLAWKTAIKTLAEAEVTFKDKAESLAERQKQSRLDSRKTELMESWWEEMLQSFTIEARQPGFVMYGTHPWTREKFQEGDTVQTSFRIATISNDSDLAIKVWINSVDRPHIATGSEVAITFDALPDQTISGMLESISDSGAKRQEWGEAVYYEGTVKFDAQQVPGLLPGMSALVEVES